MHFDCSQCKQKGTAALFVIAGLAVVVSIGIFAFRSLQPASKASPSQPPSKISTPDPKILTYVNEAQGFKFEYLKDFSVSEDSEEEFNKRGNGNFRKNFTSYVAYEPGKVLGAVVVLGKDQNFDTAPFSIWVFHNPDNLTADGWFDKYWYYPFLWGVFDWTSKGHITPDTEATISGQIGKSKIVTYQPDSPKFIYVAKDQKMCLFRLIGETGDQLLSTFKFLP